jgi:haloalkane dehalogenase
MPQWHHEKKTAMVRGLPMAYVEQGSGAPVVFQHGNPTSSYLWRNILPHLEGLGRLIACDLIGMGDSAKLQSSGPDRNSFFEQREFLDHLWEQLGIDRDVILVLHDWDRPSDSTGPAGIPARYPASRTWNLSSFR